MVETSMASRKLAAQSSSNANPAPLRVVEEVIGIVPFYAAASWEAESGRERENVQLRTLLQIDSNHVRYYWR
jgi:hypothetical protein